jgi:pimeloyl-ACP methyl ester carboxylesterase
MLPGCGHIPMSDAPDRIADLIIATCARSALDTAA